MGLVFFSLCRNKCYSFYEIYPQSETPQFTKIASVDLPVWKDKLNTYLSPDKMTWLNVPNMIFRVWDYRLNASVSFAVLVDMANIMDNAVVVITQTTTVILHHTTIFIWAIPPLSPQPPNFDDYSLTSFPPVIRIKFPDGLSLQTSRPRWRTMSSWYFDPSKPLYFDKVYSRSSQLQRFKIIIEPDFSSATLHFINTIQLTTRDFDWETPFQPMFCEDTLVYSWKSPSQCGLYTGSTLSRPTLHGDPFMTKISLSVDGSCDLSFCPASGRLVYLGSGRDTDKIIVSDFLPHQRL